MRKSDNYENRIGSYVKNSVTEETFKAYVPKPLPPNPKINFEILNDILEVTQHSLGLLDGAAIYAPDINIFLYSYIRKEAVLSSQIEGTQSSLSDLLLYENDEYPGVPIEDVAEVSNYVSAIEYATKRLNKFPLSLRLFCEIHKILLDGSRGKNKSPGEFRKTQNWIGGSRPSNAVFVPPPPIQMITCLNDLEKFIHEDKTLPTLIKIGLVHVQFETIHPFLDGNGRLGRLLITLMLIESGLQKYPLLYLSLYLKNYRNDYFELLQKVRAEGCWEKWLLFFLNAILQSSSSATKTLIEGAELFLSDKQKIKHLGAKKSASPLLVHEYLQKKIITSVKKASEDLGLTKMTITNALNTLIDLGIVKEVSGKKRDRLFVYQKYFSLISQGTEAPS